ncbi:MAG: hypothetical protein OEV37_02165 [Candidatus Berkelbacteria bacterium]|nr:hypothetical protein [Candidatus Berkelbacteria bacterium]
MNWKAALAVLAWWALWPFAAAQPVTPSPMCWVWALVGASLTLVIWPQIDWAFGVINRALAQVKIVHGPAEFPYFP